MVVDICLLRRCHFHYAFAMRIISAAAILRDAAAPYFAMPIDANAIDAADTDDYRLFSSDNADIR